MEEPQQEPQTHVWVHSEQEECFPPYLRGSGKKYTALRCTILAGFALAMVGFIAGTCGGIMWIVAANSQQHSQDDNPTSVPPLLAIVPGLGAFLLGMLLIAFPHGIALLIKEADPTAYPPTTGLPPVVVVSAGPILPSHLDAPTSNQHGVGHEQHFSAAADERLGGSSLPADRPDKESIGSDKSAKMLPGEKSETPAKSPTADIPRDTTGDRFSAFSVGDERTHLLDEQDE